MAITLPALFKLANFPKEKVDELMANIDYVTEDEKFKLANLAWSFIAEKHFVLLAIERRRILEEVKQGKRNFNPNDFEEAKAKLVHELVQKLEVADTIESIDEVKKQLESFKTKALPQDRSDSSPPLQKP